MSIVTDIPVRRSSRNLNPSPPLARVELIGGRFNENARPHGADILSLEPRGLSRGKAAAYIGVGPTKFDELVSDGRIHAPKRIDGRKVWDRRKLDEDFEALPDDAQREANSWNEVL
jgi:hypothetical protein